MGYFYEFFLFLISATYPDRAPEISAKSPALGLSQKAALIEYLVARAASLQGSHMIATLVEDAYSWCLDRNINLGPAVCPMP